MLPPPTLAPDDYQPILCVCESGFYILFIFIFGCAWVLVAAPGLSLMMVSGEYSLVAVHRLLTALASLIAKHGLKGMWASGVAAPGLPSTGSTGVAYRLSCSMACGIFPDPGLNPHLLHWQADSLPLSHQKPQVRICQIPCKWDPKCLFISDLFH